MSKMTRMLLKLGLTCASFGLLTSALPSSNEPRAAGVQTQPCPSTLIKDPGVYGPPIELVHLYYDEWPTGIAASKSGRLFSNYPPGLDSNNTNNGHNGKYTIAELFSDNTERPYPSAKINNPPGGQINYTTYPPTGANYENYLIGAQSVVIDSKDRLWILDTGRALTPNGTLVNAAYGGPKLVGVDLSNNQVFQTIVFPTTVAYGDSYLNDVRFDLRPEITASGKGVAYITDSSTEGRNGIIVVDLGTSKSWRHLDGLSATHKGDQFVTYVWGVAVYSANQYGNLIGYTAFGSDGIALSADGKTLYWKVVSKRWLYSIPTSRLLADGLHSEILAQQSVSQHTETGVTDGMETDTNGFIYHGYIEQEGISFFNPKNGSDTMFIRDPRINWVDTMSVGFDGHLYFTTNQLYLGPAMYPGTDRRQRPFSLWRVQLPNGGSKVL